MAMDSAREQSHNQEVNSQTLESMLASTKPQQEKKPRPAENSLKCPRCDSGNTKFCYYNNYSLSQPRYFCKSCRRYWTKGGTLRNVPVGGGCRKTKRPSSNSRRINHDHPITTVNNPSSYAAPAPYDSDLAIPGGFQKQPPGHLGSDGPGLMSGGDCGLIIDAVRGGFLEIPRGFHHLYGGNGNIDNNGGSFGMECGAGFGMGMGMGIGIGVLNQEMGLMGFDEFASGGAAAVKQETGNGERWGLNPWQNVGGEGSMGDLDSTRIGSWNGIGSSSWHGLLNSPLM